MKKVIGIPATAIAMVVALACTSVFGATWWVDQSIAAPGDGSSETAAVKTIMAAVERAENGDTIKVKEGVYVSGDPNKAVIDVAKKVIRIEAVGSRENTVIDGQGVGGCFIATSASGNTELIGFTIRNGYDNWSVSGAQYGILRNCVITDCVSGKGGPAGAKLSRLYNCIIRNCRAASDGAGAADCYGFNCLVENNVLRHVEGYNSCRGAGVYGGHWANSIIVSNRIESAGYNFFEGAGSQSAYLFNCVIAYNSIDTVCKGAGIREYNSTYNCLIFGNTAGGELSNVTELFIDSHGEDNFVGTAENGDDPGCVDAAHGDYRLAPSSPYIDVAQNRHIAPKIDYYLRDPAAEVDFAGNARIANRRLDYGAYEYQPTVTMPNPLAEAGAFDGTTAISASFAAAGGSGSFTYAIDASDSYGYEIADRSTFDPSLGTHSITNGYSGYCAIPIDFSFYGSPVANVDILTYIGAIGMDGGATYSSFSSYRQLVYSGRGQDCHVYTNLEHGVWTLRFESANNNYGNSAYSVSLAEDDSITLKYGSNNNEGDLYSLGVSKGDRADYLDILPCVYPLTLSNHNDIVIRPLTGLPAGVTLNASTGALSGTPTKNGTFSFYVTATDSSTGEKAKRLVSFAVDGRYSIRFNANGGSGAAMAPLTPAYNEYATLPECAYTYGCAEFLGWATEPDGAVVYHPGDRLRRMVKEVGGYFDLYAVWSDRWTLSFDNNSPVATYGMHTTLTNRLDRSFDIYKCSGNVWVPDFGTHDQPCRVGWTLEGWNTKPDGSGDGFTGNCMYYTPGLWGESRGTNIVLYAQWSRGTWSMYPEFNEGDGKWSIYVQGDDYAEFRGLYTNYTGVTSVVLPAEYNGRAIQNMGGSDWRSNSKEVIEEIVVPEGYTNLPNSAFCYFYALRRVVLPDSLRSLPVYCFENATNLVEVTLGNSVTNLSSNAFTHCPIEHIDLPATLERLCYHSLGDVKSIRAFGGVPTVCEGNFFDNAALEAFEYPANETAWLTAPALSAAKDRMHAFVGPIAALGVADAYFWTNGVGTVSFAYADSELAATVDLPAGTFSWGGQNWEITDIEPAAFAGSAVTTVRYPIAEVAKWEQVVAPDGIALVPYGDFATVHFNAAGGTFARDLQYFGVGEVRRLPTEVPVKNGCRFLGWKFNGVIYQPGDNFTGPSAAGGSANLVAQWQETGNYTLKFDLNGAQLTPPPDMAVAVEGIAYLPETSYDRAGYTFGGWTNSVGTVFAPGTAYTSETERGGTAWLYAKWTPKSTPDQEYVDAQGVVWTYFTDNYGGLTLSSVSVTNGVAALVQPEYVKGTKVARVYPNAQPVYGGGVWWTVLVSGGTAKLTGYCNSRDTLPTRIAIPDSVTVDGVAYPVTVLGDSLFNLNNNLRQVTLPKGLQKIEQYAFYSCNYLEPVTFPATLDVNEIGYCAFYNRGRYLEGRFQDGGFCYADTAKTYLANVDPDLTGTVTVPSSVKAIGNTAFGSCEAAEVVIPAGVTDLKNANGIFSNCHNLTNVVFKAARLKLSQLFWSGTENARSVAIPGAVERYGSAVCSGSTAYGAITDVYVTGKPPSWNLHDYFTTLERIHYSPRYAEDWAGYIGSYSTFEYVTDMPSCVTAVVGEACELDLVDELGLEVDADYAAGDKVTVKLEPLPKGLKLASTPVYKDPTARVKVIADYKYILSGTPTEEVDYETAPLFARVTVTKKVDGKQVKTETLQRVPLEIVAKVTREFAVGQNLTGGSAIAVADNVTAISGQPANLKLATKDGAGFAAHTVYGTVTKPGLFKVTLSYKDGKATVKSNEYWRVTAVNPGLGAGDVTWAGDQLRFDSSAMTATMLQGVKLELAVDLSGLVTVGKDAAKITFKDLPAGLAYKNGVISGTPTKVEQKAVSVTVVQNGLTVVKRFAMIVEDRQLNIVCVGAGTGKVTGAGGYGAGKKVALKAAADTKDDAKKGTVKSVFAGWYRDAGCTMKMADFDGYPDWRNPSVNYIMTTQNVTFYARFEPVAADAVEQLNVRVLGTLLTESSAYVAYSDGTRRFGIESDSLSLPKFTVSGLPSQLKFTDKYLLAPAPAMAANTIYCANDAKLPAPGTYVVTVKATNASIKQAVERRFTLVVDNFTAANALLQGQGDEATRLRNDRREKYTMSVGVAEYNLPWIRSIDGAAVKVTKLPDGLKYDAATGNITGVATKAGSFTAYVTVGTAVSTFTVVVAPLPTYVIGTFNGGEYSVDDGLDVGVSTFTITDKGKISGKITEEDGIVWTVAAASFAECDLARGEYFAELVATYKDTKARPAVTYTRTFETIITNSVAGGVLTASKPAAAEDGELELEAYQDRWKTAYKAAGVELFTDGTKKFRVYDHVEADGLAEGQSLSLKIETTGKVTGVLTDATGTFTATTTLLPLTAPSVRPMAAEVYLVFLPNTTKKFEGLAVRVQLEFMTP